MPPLPRNAARVLHELAGHPRGLTRPEIASRSGLSRPTVGAVLEDLQARHFVCDLGESSPPGGTGRPAARWLLTVPDGVVVGLDLGHSHQRVMVASAAGQPLGPPLDWPSNVDRDGPVALRAGAELIRKALSAAQTDLGAVLAIGVGLPAPIGPDGKVNSASHLPTWYGIDVADELVSLLKPRGLRPGVPVRIENDANLGALGEGLYGVADGEHDYVYVKVSTGIGMGVVLGDALVRGAHGSAAELGHVSVPAEAERVISKRSMITLPRAECPRCGRQDCLENLASCHAVVEQLIETTLRRDALEPHQPQGLDIAAVIDGAVNDPLRYPLYREAIVHAGIRIGAALGDITRLFDPSLIIVGGLLAGAGSLLLDQISPWVERATLRPASVELKLVPEGLIVRSEVFGAVALALEQIRTADLLAESRLVGEAS